MKKQVRKSLALILTVLMVITMLPLSVFAADTLDGNKYIISNSDANAPVTVEEMTDELAPGEVRTARSVVDNEDGTFDVTLYAVGASYIDDEGKTQNPLYPGTDLTISYEINAGFEVSNPSSGIEVDGRIITWTIPYNKLNTSTLNTATYTVTLTGREIGFTYETHPDATVEFKVADDNPFYWTKKIDETNVKYPAEINWNNSQGGGSISQIKSVGLMGITFDGRVPQGNWIDKATFDTLTITDYDKYYNGTFFTSVYEGQNDDKEFTFWFVISKGNGVYEVYDNVGNPVGNNGGSDLYPDFLTKTIISVDWLPINGNDGNGNIKHKITNKGWIELTANIVLANLTIKKEGVSLGSDKFNITVTFSGDNAKLLKKVYKYGDKIAKKIKGENSYIITLGQDEMFTFADLPVGINYEVKENVPYNYATPAYTDSANGALADDGATVTVTNTKLNADISVAKNVVERIHGSVAPVIENSKTYTAGDRVVYQIVITNTGELALRNVAWTEQTEFEGPFRSYQAAQAGRNSFTQRNSGYSLAPGASMTVYYAYTVSIDDQAKDSILNKIIVNAKDEGGNPVNSNDDKEIKLAHPELEISKKIIADDAEYTDYTFASGDTAFFEITVTNKGAATAKNVKLTDVWTGEGDCALVDGTEGTDPGNFDVAPGASVSFIYSVELKGMELIGMQEEFNRLIEEQEDIKQANQTVIEDVTQALIEAAVLQEDPETAISDEEYEQIVEQYNSDLEEAYAAIDAAQAIIGQIGRNGLEMKNMTITETNTVTYEYNYGADSDSVTVVIEPELQSNINIKKFVSQNADGPWHKAAILNYEGGSVYYRIVAENTGTTVENVTITDEMLGVNESTIIGPGGTYEIVKDYVIGNNSSYYKPYLVPNTATLQRDGMKDKKSSALVTVMPKPFAELKIDKKVSLDGENWTDSLAVFSDDTVEAIYKVTLTNIGTATATFTLSDNQYDGDLYTNPACTEMFNGELSLKPLRTLTLYYKVELTESTENIATYTITSGNEKDGKGTDDATATVEISPVPTVILSVTKQVVSNDDFTSAPNAGAIPWADKAEVSNEYGEGTFIFRITVANEGNQPAEVKLSDTMEGYDFGDTLAKAGIEGGAIYLDAGASQTFFVKVTISTGDEADEAIFTNVVTIVCDEGLEPVLIGDGTDSAEIKVIKTEDEEEAVIEDEEEAVIEDEELEEEEDAIITTSTNRGGGGGGTPARSTATPPPADEQPPVEIPDDIVPLAAVPAIVEEPETFVLIDNEIPLAGLPKTGGVMPILPFAGLGVLLLGIAALLSGKDEEEDAQ